jgi:hypothetical protein
VRLLIAVVGGLAAVALCAPPPPGGARGPQNPPRPPCNAQNLGMKWPTNQPTHQCRKAGTDAYSWAEIGRSTTELKTQGGGAEQKPNSPELKHTNPTR